MIKKIRENLELLFQRGLFHIFGTSLINNVIQFVTNILVVKLVSKSEYGIYTYANNIVGFFLIIRGIGLISGMLQYASEKSKDEDRAEIFKFSLVRGNQFNIILSALIFAWTIFGNIKIEGARGYLAAMCFVPVFQWLFDYVATIFRVRQENIKYAKITNINTITYFVCSIIGAYFIGVWGIIIGRYISFFVSIAVSAVWLKGIVPLMKAVRASNYKEKKSLVKYSLTACASSSIAELLYLLDVFMIGIFIPNPMVIASYKVATQIPTALGFIPLCISTFIYPYFASHNTDMKWIKKNYIYLLKILVVINGLICLGLIILAPYIVTILWGESYRDAITPFRILAINYFFAGTFRVPCGNILAMLRKVNVNLVVSIVSGISNIILDIVLIKKFGSLGAAYATLLVVIISSGIAFPYLMNHINKKRNMGV